MQLSQQEYSSTLSGDFYFLAGECCWKLCSVSLRNGVYIILEFVILNVSVGSIVLKHAIS